MALPAMKLLLETDRNIFSAASSWPSNGKGRGKGAGALWDLLPLLYLSRFCPSTVLHLLHHSFLPPQQSTPICFTQQTFRKTKALCICIGVNQPYQPWLTSSSFLSLVPCLRSPRVMSICSQSVWAPLAWFALPTTNSQALRSPSKRS